jgi:hypothetical protein
MRGIVSVLFAWLISHQPAVLFSQNKPATSQQYFSLRTNQHQPPAKRTGWSFTNSVICWVWMLGTCIFSDGGSRMEYWRGSCIRPAVVCTLNSTENMPTVWSPFTQRTKQPSANCHRVKLPYLLLKCYGYLKVYRAQGWLSVRYLGATNFDN